MNAAGLTNRGTLDETTVELWDLLMNVNARAPLILTQEAARFMRNNKVHGSIVNIISDQWHGGAPFLTAYLLSDESEMMTGALIDFDQKVVGGFK